MIYEKDEAPAILKKGEIVFTPYSTTSLPSLHDWVKRTVTVKVFDKSSIIDALKRYQEDYECSTDDEESIRNVIEWFINCTPDYKEEV